MKKNTKGFTLIELLAVIVILAIIALIAVPVILNILNKARISAAEDTSYSVLNAAELYYAETLLDAPTVAFVETTLELPTDAEGTDAKLQVKGTVPSDGAVTINANGTATITEDLIIGEISCFQKGTEVDCVKTSERNKQ